MKILRIFLVILFAFAITSCNNSCSQDRETSKPEENTTTIPIVPPKVITPTEQKIDDINVKIEANNAIIAKAMMDKDLISQLSAEKDNLQLKIKLNTQYIQQLEDNNKAYSSQVKDKDEEIKTAKLDAWKTKLWWMAGIMGLLSIVAGGVAIGFPLLRPIAVKAAAIGAGISVLLLITAESLATVAWLLSLVPYILIGAAIIGAICVFIFARHWWLDHHGFNQVVSAIDPVKNQVKDFSTHMNNELDSFVINKVKDTKAKLKNAKNKLKEIEKKI